MIIKEVKYSRNELELTRHAVEPSGVSRSIVAPFEPCMLLADAVSTAVPSLPCEHALHIFPSFGIGGVPLRMVRIMNHFGKRFRHTVVALDDNFEAAAAVAGEVDVRLTSVQRPRGGVLGAVGGGALTLRRLRPDL